jgi:hypothetical protein
MARDEAVGPVREELSREDVALVDVQENDPIALVEQRGEPWERRDENENEGGAARAHGIATVPE